MLTVESLFIYPIKSLGGVQITSANCTELGLEYDRRWVIVDRNHHFITQRQLPKMASISVSLDNNQLILHHQVAGKALLPFDLSLPADCEITVWKDTVSARQVPGEINQWLNDALGDYRKGPVQLMQLVPETKRVVAEKYLPDQDSQVSFADACPYLFTFQESLASLNQQTADNIPMDRFRANIVLSGAKAWHEYQWQEISNDALRFGLIGPCQRCQMTSIDQQSGEIATPGEPLQTLMKQFPVADKKLPFFGQHARLLGNLNGRISVGDHFDWR
ncbi:MAG: MOSC domain-containing protein [Aestuariibacter sp.]